MKLATSYFGCRIRRHVQRDMAQLAEHGFDLVIHTFSENDLYYSPETMRDIVSCTHEAGLAVQIDPWGVAGIFGGEAFSRWIVEEPDLQQRGRSGRTLGGACLNHPRLRDKLASWVDAAAASGADQVFWDEPHWSPTGPRNPAGEFCVCRHCETAALQWAACCDDDELQTAVADLAAAPVKTLEQFRAASVLRLLAELCRLASDRGLGSNICVLPLGVLDQPPLDWPRIAALPGVETFGTDPYWQAFDIETNEERNRFIDTNASAAIEACRASDLRSMLWIQAFRIPIRRQEDLLEGAKRLLRHRPDVAAVWGFEACAHMSALACEDAHRFWERLVSLLREEAARAGPDRGKES